MVSKFITSVHIVKTEGSVGRVFRKLKTKVKFTFYIRRLIERGCTGFVKPQRLVNETGTFHFQGKPMI